MSVAPDPVPSACPRAQLSVVRGSDLTAAAQAEIVQLCSSAFAEDYGPLFTLLGPAAVHVLGRQEGTLVSHACWVTRWLQPADLPALRTAYAEGVVVAPALQRRGLGSQVMRHLATQIGDYDLGALATGSVSFYARLGWELWQGPTAIRTAHGLLATPGEQPMILRTTRTPPLDLGALLTAEWREGELW